MKEDLIHEIIGKVIAEEASESEIKIFHEWLSASNQNREEFELHKKTWKETKLNFKIAGSEIVFREILDQIDDQQEDDHTALYAISSRARNRFTFVTKIAASLLLVASVFFLLKFYNTDKTNQIVEIATVEKSNIAGQKSKIFLPDGSVVWLNSESKISYPEKFTGDTREVELQGEAFFSVIKNKELPFIVRSGNLSTIVLGTTFNVKAYEDEPYLQIALKTGQVKVEIEKDAQKNYVLLKPGEALKYTKSNHVAVKKPFDAEKLLGWKDGKIVFKDADLDEIVNTLSRWYGVEFSFVNMDHSKWSYTGTFDDAVLENVLHSISFTKGFTYSIHQKNVTLKFN